MEQREEKNKANPLVYVWCVADRYKRGVSLAKREKKQNKFGIIKWSAEM